MIARFITRFINWLAHWLYLYDVVLITLLITIVREAYTGYERKRTWLRLLYLWLTIVVLVIYSIPLYIGIIVLGIFIAPIEIYRGWLGYWNSEIRHARTVKGWKGTVLLCYCLFNKYFTPTVALAEVVLWLYIIMH